MFSSFSAVATREVKGEAAIMAFSVRKFYDCPIFLVCDQETREFLEAEGIPNLHFSMITEGRLARLSMDYAAVVPVNEFHRIDCIALKMECVEQAAAQFGDTLFIDTDIIVAKPLHHGIDLLNFEMILSPHYNYVDRVHNYKTYGVFNAGYLWTRMPMAGPVWKEIYLNRSSFYEQQGMIWFFEHFHCGMFDIHHNVGFWRMPQVSTQMQPLPRLDRSTVDWVNVKSFHAHMIRESYEKADPGLTRVYSQHMEIVYEELPEDIKGYINEIRAKQ
jgi:hypothetical protein